MRHVDKLVNRRGHLLRVCLLSLPKVLVRGRRLILSLTIAAFVVVRAVSVVLLLGHDRVAGDDGHGRVDASRVNAVAPC